MEPHNMVNPTIVSLAFIKTNWDLRQKSYLDNFVPIVAESLRFLKQDIISLQEVQESVIQEFGLRIPQSAIEAILKRTKKYKYVQIDQGIYKRNNDELAKLDFHDIRQIVMEKHEKLINALIEHCNKVWGIKWSEEDAENALQFYLQDNELSIITASTYGTTIPMALPPAKNAKYFVGAFIQNLQKTNSSLLEYLDTVVKGNMLANAIFLPDPDQAAKKFKNTEVYFDTTFLIYALGYAGEARKSPCIELLNLLYETGASLKCFRHTLDEIRNIIDSLAKRISKGQKIEAYGPSIPSVEYFLSEGFTASDLELLLVKLERDLEVLRIRIVEKPEYEKEHVIDEKGLEDAFKNIHRFERARQRDVDSIAAIVRLRKGRDYPLLEDCRAVFITSNTAIAKACANYFCANDKQNIISPCLTDYALTNILWLKKPMAFPELPRKRIIADCYAATQPDERMWRKYLDEIDKLSKDGNVTEDDYYLLRYSLEAKQALMELTQGDVDVFSRGTVKEILDLIRSQIREEYVAQIQAEKERAEKAEEAIEQVKKDTAEEYTIRLKKESKRAEEAEAKVENYRLKEMGRERKIKTIANKIASILARAVTIIIGILLVIGLLSSLNWGLKVEENSWAGYLLSGLQVIVLSWGIENLIWGTTLKTLSRKVEIKTAVWFEGKLKIIMQ